MVFTGYGERNGVHPTIAGNGVPAMGSGMVSTPRCGKWCSCYGERNGVHPTMPGRPAMGSGMVSTPRLREMVFLLWGAEWCPPHYAGPSGYGDGNGVHPYGDGNGVHPKIAGNGVPAMGTGMVSTPMGTGMVSTPDRRRDRTAHYDLLLPERRPRVNIRAPRWVLYTHFPCFLL